jgi:hypothetical protein
MADDFDALMTPTAADLERVGIYRPKSAEEFPFDPSLRIDEQEGLDKLRCEPDRAFAQVLFEQYMRLETTYWGTEDAERDRERRKRREEDREVARIVPWATKAFKGEMSIDAKLLAQRVLFPDGYVHLNRTMLPALREFARALHELKRSGKA